MHCWSQSDAINSVSLCLNETLNHVSYSGKQLRNGTPENRCVQSAVCLQWHEKEKHGECAHLMASHMLILMMGLPGAQVCWSGGCGKEVNAFSHSYKLLSTVCRRERESLESTTEEKEEERKRTNRRV